MKHVKLTYVRAADARAAIEKYDGHEMSGLPMKVYSPSARDEYVLVQGIPHTTGLEQLEEAFAEHGRLCRVILQQEEERAVLDESGTSGVSGIVRFYKCSDARKAAAAVTHVGGEAVTCTVWSTVLQRRVEGKAWAAMFAGVHDKPEVAAEACEGEQSGGTAVKQPPSSLEQMIQDSISMDAEAKDYESDGSCYSDDGFGGRRRPAASEKSHSSRPASFRGRESRKSWGAGDWDRERATRLRQLRESDIEWEKKRNPRPQRREDSRTKFRAY
jgi:hypothetical protein